MGGTVYHGDFLIKCHLGAVLRSVRREKSCVIGAVRSRVPIPSSDGDFGVTFAGGNGRVINN